VGCYHPEGEVVSFLSFFRLLWGNRTDNWVVKGCRSPDSRYGMADGMGIVNKQWTKQMKNSSLDRMEKYPRRKSLLATRK
jgi:hypothetical protein